MELSRNLVLIYGASFLRSTGIGMAGVILGIYLSRAGFSAIQIGLVIGVGLAGIAVALTITSFRSDRFGRRRTLALLSVFVGLGGLALTLTTRLSTILLLAFLGMLDAKGRDRGAVFALEQVIVPELVSPGRRTWALAWHTLVLDAGHALGALLGVLPFLLRRWMHVEVLASYQYAFGLYGTLNLLTAVFYLSLSPQVEAIRAATPGVRGLAMISAQSRKVVAWLAALSSLDNLGGGFLTGALIAYWFLRRFGALEESLALLFFAARVANAGSHLVAAWLSARIGLLKTMVFTHMASSLFLMGVPFAPSFLWAALLFLARECLVEMDVPTRQSYLMGVVRSNERVFASGITNLTRNVAWALTSFCGGYVMQDVALATPLFLGGGIKITYDVLLYVAFRGLKPLQEQAAPAPAGTTVNHLHL